MMSIKPLRWNHGMLSLLFCLLPLMTADKAYAQGISAMDNRLGEPRHLDLAYTFPEYHSKDAWLLRAAELRKQILVSAGLCRRSCESVEI